MKRVAAILTMVTVLTLLFPARADAQLLERFSDVADLNYAAGHNLQVSFANPELGAVTDSVRVLAKKDVQSARMTVKKAPADVVVRIANSEIGSIPAKNFDMFQYTLVPQEKGSYEVEFLVSIVSAESGKTHNRTISVTASLQGCFIATACYGSPLAEEIDVLRDFRDTVLLESRTGARLVDTYYTASPPMARLIERNDALRYVVRRGFVGPVVDIVNRTRSRWDQ